LRTFDSALRHPGAELRFIGDDGHVLPLGEIGEIYSRFAGNPDFTYHNKPEKRSEIDRAADLSEMGGRAPDAAQCHQRVYARLRRAMPCGVVRC